MPPAHECFGDRHYPCGSRLANEDKRRRESAGSGLLLRGGDRRRASPIGAIGKCKWLQEDRVPTRLRSASCEDAPLSRRGEPADERPRRTISGVSGGGTDPRGQEDPCGVR